jgi:hypothetical protein
MLREQGTQVGKGGVHHGAIVGRARRVDNASATKRQRRSGFLLC